MAKKSFALNTLPHVAEISGVELEFLPEVNGAEFLDAYEALQERLKAVGMDTGETAAASVEQIRESTTALRAFLASLMLEESAARFEGIDLPDRILVQLLEWVMGPEVYGAGRPTGSSNGSAGASRTPGTRSTGASRSKGSTPARGRSRAS